MKLKEQKEGNMFVSTLTTNSFAAPDKEGYVADNEDNGIEFFPKNFTEHLNESAKQRICSNPPRINRRLDALARFLEQDMTCIAVMYDSQEKVIWVSSNTIHEGSRSVNNSTKNITNALQLLVNHNASIDDIIKGLTAIINKYIKQNERFLANDIIKKMGVSSFNRLLEDILRDLFFSGIPTKSWVNNFNFKKFDPESKYTVLLNKIIPKMCRIARDFIKLRNSLIDRLGCESSLNHEIITTIDKGAFKILHLGKHKAHAETRMIIKQNHVPDLKNSYVGVSKLCCAHCGLAVKVSDTQVRGQHGRGFNTWVIPEPILNNPEQLKSFFGDKAYQQYQNFTPQKKGEALKYVEGKAGSPNDRKARDMLPDSSSSDVEFGLEDSASETRRILSGITFEEINSLAKITKYIFTEHEVFTDLFISSPIKFKKLATENTLNLLIYFKGKLLFEDICVIYDANQKVCEELIKNENELSHGDFYGLYDTVDWDIEEIKDLISSDIFKELQTYIPTYQIYKLYGCFYHLEFLNFLLLIKAN